MLWPSPAFQRGVRFGYPTQGQLGHMEMEFEYGYMELGTDRLWVLSLFPKDPYYKSPIAMCNIMDTGQ